jgi:hypothetical protein
MGKRKIFLQWKGYKMKTNDWLELAYTVDLLSRMTESIETYLDDDRWDGIAALHAEIKESNKLIKKYYKRVNQEVTQ